MRSTCQQCLTHAAHVAATAMLLGQICVTIGPPHLLARAPPAQSPCPCRHPGSIIQPAQAFPR